MNLTFLTDGIYPYQLGGMQKHSFYLAEFMAREGVNVHLYHLGGEGSVPFSDQARKNIKEFVVPFPTPGKIPGHYMRNSCRHATQLAEMVKIHSPTDFIYAQGYTAWEILRRKARGESFPPVCVNFHGMEALQPAASRRNRLEQLLLAPPMRRQLLQADYVQSLGGKLTDLLLDLGVSRDKIWEIPIGLDEEWLANQMKVATQPRRFVFIGRYERRKGIEELNEVLKQLGPEQDFHFDFVGPIPESLQLLGSAFTYHGLVKEQERIKAILDESDVLVSPSHSEGMPTVILEAMARGCAIIATDVGAVCEEVDSTVGWLIPPKDVLVLKETLLAAINLAEATLVEKKQAAQIKITEKFLWPPVARETTTRISKVIKSS